MSRFVSAGTDEEPSERDEAWLKAQEEIEAKHRAKVEASKQEGGKSLYETLQANKAAKQEAFEESIRLKNQFRSLDDDEVEFLDSVLESTRAKEAEVRKETNQQLDAFRRLQEEAEKTEIPQDEPEVLETEAWKTGMRKRKKGREVAIGGIKLRRTSTAEQDAGVVKEESAVTEQAQSSLGEGQGKVEMPTSLPSERREPSSRHVSDSEPSRKSSVPSAGLGLAAYSSDEDD